jgi:hypothetical protein
MLVEVASSGVSKHHAQPLSPRVASAAVGLLTGMYLSIILSASAAGLFDCLI